MGDSECYIGYGIFQAGNEIFFQDDIDMKCYSDSLICYTFVILE